MNPMVQGVAACQFFLANFSTIPVTLKPVSILRFADPAKAHQGHLRVRMFNESASRDAVGISDFSDLGFFDAN